MCGVNGLSKMRFLIANDIQIWSLEFSGNGWMGGGEYFITKDSFPYKRYKTSSEHSGKYIDSCLEKSRNTFMDSDPFGLGT